MSPERDVAFLPPRLGLFYQGFRRHLVGNPPNNTRSSLSGTPRLRQACAPRVGGRHRRFDPVAFVAKAARQIHARRRSSSAKTVTSAGHPTGLGVVGPRTGCGNARRDLHTGGAFRIVKETSFLRIGVRATRSAPATCPLSPDAQSRSSVKACLRRRRSSSTDPPTERATTASYLLKIPPSLA